VKSTIIKNSSLQSWLSPVFNKFNFSPLSLDSFPPVEAWEVNDPGVFLPPSGEGCPSGQEGGSLSFD